MAPTAGQDVSELLRSAQGRNAVRGLIKMVKAASTVDKVLGRIGAESHVVKESAAVHQSSSDDFVIDHDGEEPSYLTIGATAFGALGGGGFGAWALTHPLRIATPPTNSGTIVSESTQTANGVTVHSESITQTSTSGTPGVTPAFATGYEIAGIASLVGSAVAALVAIREIGVAIKFAHATKVLENFNEMALQTRESLSQAGYDQARDDHGLDGLLDYVHDNLAATQSALRSAERGTPSFNSLS